MQKRNPDRTLADNQLPSNGFPDADKLRSGNSLSGLPAQKGASTKTAGNTQSVMTELEGLNLIENAMEQYALWDMLSGCYNFRYLSKKIEREVSRAQRYSRPFSVVVVGVDNLSLLAESYGLQTYETCLLEVMSFLVNTIRSGIDMVGRFDENRFIVVLPETSGGGAETFCRRIHQGFLKTQGEKSWRPLPIGLSFGIAFYPGHGKEPLELIAKADLACDYSQTNNGNLFCIAPIQNSINTFEF